jgi:hypothetical protein
MLGHYARGLMSLQQRVNTYSDRKSNEADALEQLRLGVTPGVSDVDDEWDPAVVHDGLWVANMNTVGQSTKLVE